MVLMVTAAARKEIGDGFLLFVAAPVGAALADRGGGDRRGARTEPLPDDRLSADRPLPIAIRMETTDGTRDRNRVTGKMRIAV